MIPGGEGTPPLHLTPSCGQGPSASFTAAPSALSEQTLPSPPCATPSSSLSPQTAFSRTHLHARTTCFQMPFTGSDGPLGRPAPIPILGPWAIGPSPHSVTCGAPHARSWQPVGTGLVPGPPRDPIPGAEPAFCRLRMQSSRYCQGPEPRPPSCLSCPSVQPTRKEKQS